MSETARPRFCRGWYACARRADSPNFGPRPEGEEVSLVVIHNISLPPGDFSGHSVEDFFHNRLNAKAHPYFETIQDLQVSSHFFIRRDGELVQFVSVAERAWHAGASVWDGRGNCNDYSVGVELEGTDDQAFTPAQYAALWPLLEGLCSDWPIRAIVGHSDIAPGRKTDPGAHFDWAAVRSRFPLLALAEKPA